MPKKKEWGAFSKEEKDYLGDAALWETWSVISLCFLTLLASSESSAPEWMVIQAGLSAGVAQVLAYFRFKRFQNLQIYGQDEIKHENVKDLYSDVSDDGAQSIAVLLDLAEKAQRRN